MNLAPDDRDACRLAFAAIAMHAVLSTEHVLRSISNGVDMTRTVSIIAAAHADALLAALETPADKVSE